MKRRTKNDSSVKMPDGYKTEISAILGTYAIYFPGQPETGGEDSDNYIQLLLSGKHPAIEDKLYSPRDLLRAIDSAYKAYSSDMIKNIPSLNDLFGAKPQFTLYLSNDQFTNQKYVATEEQRSAVDSVAEAWVQNINPKEDMDKAKYYIRDLLFNSERLGYTRNFSKEQLLYSIDMYAAYVEAYKPKYLYRAHNFFGYRRYFEKYLLLNKI